MKFLPLFAGLLVIILSSCTLVTSTNIPGKKATKVPKSLIGKYEMQYPEDIAAFMGGADAQTFVTFEQDRMTFTSEGQDNTSMLGDSLFISTIKKQIYISMGAPPNLIVFKVVKSGKELHLFPMFCNEGVTTAELQPYFSNVTEVPGEIDENGEMGSSSYEVTIDNKKLDKFFSSSIVRKEPFVLKRVD